MRMCSNCGGQNSDQARFCQFCASPLAEVGPSHEARKIVSVVFTDVTGSTSLGERLDPETLRRVMFRYFDAMRAVIERHGGTVEKFIGDAVMAVFGIPQVHEDDALRAVRAAAEMRATLDALNAELERDPGVTIRTRTGVATGEVVAGADASSGERLVTGDTVNVAARLEQSAQPGEILISATTHALVRDAVDAEPLEALELKGKTEPVPAYRLVAVRSGVAGRERHLESPMVGRERQLRMLLDTFDASVTERACHLFTVLGSPGVGKSRLVREFLGAISESASVHAGRCLSYGDGITFWPLDEIARSIAGVSEAAATDELIARLREKTCGRRRDGCCRHEDRGSSRSVARTSRPGRRIVGREEAIRARGRRAANRARDRRHPLGRADDARPYEQVADWSRDAPIVLLCTARPELIDVRPNWAGGKPNATSILLEPLTTSESDQLIENLVGSAELPPHARERITSAAEGNPLFVEEMLGMLIDDGLLRRDDGRWVATGDLSEIAVPSTIQALIAARLDRLVSEERTVIERGAVEGKLFHVGSVTALAPEPLRSAVRDRLMSLVRKELIRPDRSDFAGDEAFRFRHLLIRDAAYESMPKETRAELHERFAEWLASRASETPGGLDAIPAYHYEQAYRYRTELGGAGERGRELAQIAGARYSSAGIAALSRTDASTAIALLERAASLVPDDFDVRLGLADAYELEGSMDRAEELAAQVQHDAEAVGNASASARAELRRAVIRSWTDPSWTGREHLETVRRLAREFEVLGDDLGMARALLADALYARRSEGLAAARRAAEHARRAKDTRAEADALGYEAIELFWGPTPAADSAARCETILAAGVPDRGAEAFVLASLGGLRAMLGDLEAGWLFASKARAILLDLGTRNRAHAAFVGGYIGWFAGDLDNADAGWREGYEIMDSIGETNRLSSFAGLVAVTLALRGRRREALEFVRIGTEAGATDDQDTQSLTRMAESIVRSRDGDHDDAVRLATEAVAFLEGREGVWQQGDDRFLGDALAAADRGSEAADEYAHALALYEAKGVVPLIDRTRTTLAVLGR